MAIVSPLPLNSPLQPPLPTPSPFSYSVASTGWRSGPTPIQVCNFVLRFLALLLSFVSAFTLTFPSSKHNKTSADPSFHDYHTLMYCFIVNITAFVYSSYQLFKCIWDMAQQGIFISEKTSDYISFIFDQMAGYLLISSSSLAVLTIQEIDSSKALWKAALVSVILSFLTFLVIQSCALLSGYKLCKRIVW